jgi:flagellar hook assembly protein FlgD
LPEAGNVSLVIYDVLGREVANLADGYQQAGRYTVTWNSTRTSGIPVASGVYFARLRILNDLGTVKFAKTTRLLLMK